MSKNYYEQEVWVRVAGHADKIRAGDPHQWRAFVMGFEGIEQGEEIPLVSWTIRGQVTGDNCIPGASAKRDARGLFAWIDLFGDVAIKDGKMTIRLLEP